MNKDNFTYSFKTYKTPKEIFRVLLDVPEWWSGIYGETITGKSEKVNDEFVFKAGGGAHYSKQKLVELVPDKKIVWEVTDSNLSFLSDTKEWTGSKIRFDILSGQDATTVTFIHEGLVPAIECYKECSNGWMKYLANLKQKLNEPVSA